VRGWGTQKKISKEGRAEKFKMSKWSKLGTLCMTVILDCAAWYMYQCTEYLSPDACVCAELRTKVLALRPSRRTQPKPLARDAAAKHIEPMGPSSARETAPAHTPPKNCSHSCRQRKSHFCCSTKSTARSCSEPLYLKLPSAGCLSGAAQPEFASMRRR
jgi:hypothetical protein